MATRPKRAASADDFDNEDHGTSLVRVNPQEAAQLRAIQLGALPDPTNEEEEEETAADRIARMLGDTGPDAKAVVKLYKVKPDGQSFCQEYTVSQFENGGLNMVRRQWGPGDYKIMLYGTLPGTTKMGLRARDTLTLEAETVTAVAEGSGSDVAKILQAMQEQNRAVMEALTNRPVVDPMAQMAQTLALMTSMREAFGMTNKPEKSSVSEIIDAVRELKGIAGELGGEKEDEGGMASLVKLATPIMGMVQARLAQQQQPEGFPAISMPEGLASYPQPAPSQAGVLDPNPPLPEEDEDMNALAMMLMHTHLKILCKQAKQNGDVQAGAEYVLDQLPDEMLDALEAPEWWSQLSMIAPFVVPHQAWFTSVRDRALAILAEEDAANPEGGGAAPNAP